MFFHTKINCPHCQSTRCRESRWHSHEEKRDYQERNTPYRCLDCSYRFLVEKSTPWNREVLVSIPVALSSIVLAVIVTFWLTREEYPSALVTPATSAVLDPDVRGEAEAGYPDAQFRLGDAILKDLSRSTENSETAVRWLRMAAANGNSEAMLRLGRMYRDGVGVEKDLVQAYVWVNRALVTYDADATHEREAIARALTPKDLKKAQSQLSADSPESTKPAGKSDAKG